MSPNEAVKHQKYACSRCRRSKVRCLIGTVKEHGKCRRCYVSEEECVFELVAPRQQRQRADTRLSILEKQVEALKAAFESAHPTPNTPCSLRSSRNQETEPAKVPAWSIASSPRSSNAQTEELGEHENPSSQPGSDTAVIPGYIGSDLLSFNSAAELLADFVLHALPQYPVLVPVDGDSLESLRQNKPILLFAMLTAANRAKDPALFNKLHSRLLRLLTEKVVINGERSLELLQAVLITEVWYNPPDDLRRLNFYLWIQIAGTMAFQLGLWWDSHMLAAVTNSDIDDNMLQRWRTAMVVYLSVSTVAVSSRRPSMIKMSNGARTALTKFTANAVCLNDKRLAAWMGLQIIAEEVEDLRLQVRSMLDSHSASSALYADTLQKLGGRLDLFERTSAELMNTSLRVHYLWTRCKLKELVMFHHRASHAILQGDLGGGQVLQCGAGEAALSAGLEYARAVMSLVETCHNILDNVIQSDLVTYLNAPTITTVRALYAMKELLILRESLSQESNPSSSLSTSQILSVELYLEQLDNFLTKAQGAHGHKIPTMALSTIKRIRNRLTHGDRQLSRSTLASSRLQASINDNENLGESDDLERVTTSTMPEMRQNQVQISHPASSRMMQSHGSITDVESTIQPYRSDVDAESQPVANAASSGSHFADSEFDLMSMPDEMPFSSVWDAVGDSLSYEWHGVPGEFLPVNWP